MPNPKRVIQSDRDGILDSCQIESIKRQSERLANEMIVKRINGFRGAWKREKKVLEDFINTLLIYKELFLVLD